VTASDTRTRGLIRALEVVTVAGLYPPHLGGEELVAAGLAERQARRHHVTVYTSDIGNRAFRGSGSTDGATVADSGGFAGGGGLRVVRDRALAAGNTPVVPRLAERLLRHRPRPDVIHVHTGLALTPEIVRLAAALRKVPYVAHVHLMVRPSSPAGRVLLPAYEKTLVGGFLRGAARVICLTGAMRETVAARFRVPPDRIDVVPNGVDLETFAPPGPGGRETAEVLFVGRLTAQKNVMAAVRAVAALPGRVRLRVVGDGELYGDLTRVVSALGLADVDFTGRLDPPRLAEAYRRASVLVMPSTHEGLPLVLLEAMASGTPVVCSDLPELIETGADAVVPVEPTPDALAGALHSVLTDPGYAARLSRAGLRRATAYSWDAMVDAVDGVYARALAVRR
jgi:glycosyltransferase involved in cell wall biosynthesis